MSNNNKDKNISTVPKVAKKKTYKWYEMDPNKKWYEQTWGILILILGILILIGLSFCIYFIVHWIRIIKPGGKGAEGGAQASQTAQPSQGIQPVEIEEFKAPEPGLSPAVLI